MEQLITAFREMLILHMIDCWRQNVSRQTFSLFLCQFLHWYNNSIYWRI